MFLDAVKASSNSSVASNNRSKLLHGFSQQVVELASLGNSGLNPVICWNGIFYEVLIPFVVALVRNDFISTFSDDTTNGLLALNSRTLYKQSSVALYPLIFAVTSVATYFLLIMPLE
ncbi:MAG: hypothetical protein EZS28_032314 [Streblomastix strix]|uniref:Uncharacterized protein n=1 Tax=Streblomastix strix TaxID=222440 RepID=A0A5J4UQ21_9EUKA|nr:MAG: hypothetical protein EZS28_032314 [Streblomastix strix]